MVGVVLIQKIQSAMIPLTWKYDVALDEVISSHCSAQANT